MLFGMKNISTRQIRSLQFLRFRIAEIWKKLLDFYNILRLLLIHRTGFLDVDWPW